MRRVMDSGKEMGGRIKIFKGLDIAGQFEA